MITIKVNIDKKRFIEQYESFQEKYDFEGKGFDDDYLQFLLFSHVLIDTLQSFQYQKNDISFKIL